MSGGNPSSETPREADGVGQQLRAAREAKNLSLAEAAQSLKLAPRQVAALESEDWSSLPGNTMVRGFVRNYARVLNLDADALMHGLDATQMRRTLQLEASAGTSSSLPQASSQAEQRDYLAVVGGLVLLVLALLAYFYVPQNFWQEQLAALTGEEAPSVAAEPSTVVEPPTAVIEPATVAAVGSPTAGGVAQATLQSASQAPTTVLPPAAAKPDAKATAEVKAAPATETKAEASAPVKPEAKPADTLKLSFTQAAWVEVRDGRGEVVAFGVKQAGVEQEVKGPPPFSLVLGNARYVAVEYKGKPIDLVPHTTKGVARLSLE